MLEKLFSVKNKNTHKIITILGIKFKFESKKLIDRIRIQELENQNSTLIFEYNNTKNELNAKVEQFETLEKEYFEYKQAQIIDKQEADKIRGKVYKWPIDLNADEPRVYAINWINDNSRVLDVGCACGEFGEKLKEIKNARVIGLEYNTQSIEIAKSTNAYENIIQCDLNKYKNISIGDVKFDYIVCNDVLEHIYEPKKVLNYLKQYLRDDGYFLFSIPNISHASIKANLLLNNFDYTHCGLLDETHIRFFTYKTVVNFLTDLKLEIEECKLTHYMGINGLQPVNPYPELPQEIKEFILKDKHSSIVQYIVKCKKSETENLIDINLEKIKYELNNTPYMQGVEEYIEEMK